MKKYFLIICIAFTPVSIQAQWSLGGKAGINWSTINYPRSKLGDHADYLFSHLFQQAKISSKKSREEKNNSFYQSSIKLIYGRTEGKSSNDDSFEPPNTISANSIISISKSHGFVTPS